MEVISECAVEHTGLQANNGLKLFLNEYSYFCASAISQDICQILEFL